MLKVGIVGHGFVGKAVDDGLKNVHKMIIDPNYGISVEDLYNYNPEVVFVAVPTPMMADGSIDSSILEDVVFKISMSSIIDPVIVIKSTCTPDVLDKLEMVCPYVYNPEFLTERNAYQDFINPPAIILGYSQNSEASAIFMEDFYRNNTKCNPLTPFIRTTAKTAAFIKYATNTFLASKVIFFNQLFDLYNESGETEWEKLRRAMSYDRRISGSHTQVPGPDGKLGFGGACFPKDVAAFLTYAEKHGKELSVLKEVANTNAEIRTKYNQLDEREIAQNVNFNYAKKMKGI
jgi:UDPglucose 6-dehydrogenase